MTGDEAVRAYVSRLWAEDWDGPEDSAGDRWDAATAALGHLRPEWVLGLLRAGVSPEDAAAVFGVPVVVVDELRAAFDAPAMEVA